MEFMFPQMPAARLIRELKKSDLSMDNSTVDVWRVHVPSMHPILSDLQDLLSPDEAERASRFYLRKDRQRFMVTRGALRCLLSAYLEKSPAEIRFQYSDFGKMSLAPPFSSSGLCFNLSHSGDVALVAVTYHSELGVDVEAVHRDIDYEHLAREFFSVAEVTSLLDLSYEARHRAFFECWCGKEAYIKARGEGLSYPLDAFTVSIGDRGTETLQVHDDPDESSRWRVCSLSLGPEYAGAIVVLGHAWELRIREFTFGQDSITAD